ncbi:MAG: CZB domain-containing protein [Polyangiaceae bacterium]|nr:CZB domain-containing protein [Polyangiaceae bacterium]
MKVDDAIAAHSKWKQRLKAYVDGSSKEKLSCDVVGKDDQCDLGRWLHSNDAKKLGAKAAELIPAHAEFHRCAADIVRCADHGKKAEAESKLAMGKDFSVVSAKVVTMLSALRAIMP